MPRKSRTPSYRFHRPSGQAVVTLCGRDHYLGKYDTVASRTEYDRLIAEWLANGRQPPSSDSLVTDLTVNEVLAAYWRHANGYYRKNGEPTSEIDYLRGALRELRRLYGDTPVRAFTPSALIACRQAMIDAGLARSVVNGRISRIKRVFKWAASQEMVPVSVYQALITVDGLKRGRSNAKETQPVRPVPEEHITAVLPKVSKHVRAMIELQLLTGMRPGEVRMMRGCDIDTGGKIWTYVPRSHKTEHIGRERVIYLGRQAQEILKPFLRTDLSATIFSPRMAEQERNRVRRQNRKSPMTPSQSKRRPKRNRRRAPRDFYTKDAYVLAIRRACEKADVPRWSPNQLRHNAATRFRKEYGLEVAQIMLGHASAEVTQIYAERDSDRAKAVVAKIG